jgi:hypothetical protein
MLEVEELRLQEPTVRTRVIQARVFGFTMFELQRVLAEQWELPQLLLTLMNDSCAHLPRVRNVVLASNLVRHSAKGWDDPALPDDYKDIADLLRMPVEDVVEMIAVDAGIACDIHQPHRGEND